MSRRALPAIAALALLGGCAPAQEVFFRPVGDRVLYWYTYYPELSVSLPPGPAPAARAAIGARGVIEKHGDAPAYVLNVRIVIDNPTCRQVVVRRDHQYVSGFDGDLHQAVGMRHDGTEVRTAVVGPGQRGTLRVEFRPGAGPAEEERTSFVYRLRYSVHAHVWPQDVEFVRIMPGDITPPVVWFGVMILRF